MASQKPRVAVSIQESVEFVRQIHRDLSPDVPSSLAGQWFSRRDEGSLHLSEIEAKAYRLLVDALDRDFNKKKDLSRRSIERLLQDAIFHSLDFAGRAGGGFEGRLATASVVLRERLSRSAVAFRCFLPIEGFAEADLPLRFGRLQFVKFGDAQRRQLAPKGRGSNRSRLARTVKDGTLWHKPAAVVGVEARDSESALTKARLVSQETLDELNFLADVIPYNYAWLRQRGGVAPALDGSAVVSDESLSLPQESVGPLGPFNVKELKGHPWLLHLFQSLSTLSSCAKAGSAGEVLLAGFRWAGRATVETRREQSFLLFAIALESVVLSDGQHQELTHRLALRVARLLGRTASDRRSIQGVMKRLYGVRSKIVHSGAYEVTDEDLGLLRALTKRVLLKLLRRRKNWNWKASELGEWFERLVTS